MNKQPFQQEYAQQYDYIYSDKNYEAECDLLSAAFERYGSAPVRSILDLGCGTGNHALPLARRGYVVTGVDRSQEMLAVARQKASRERGTAGSFRPPVYLEGDVRTFRGGGEPVDAVLMMFAVLGYQLTNDDVLSSLRTARGHLRTGGLFLCDLWYGPAVLAIRPGTQVKVTQGPSGSIVRAASGKLDIDRHLVDILIRTWQLGEPSVPGETCETHQVRFFFPQELALYMKHAGLEVVSLSAMGDLDKRADETTWNAFVVARAL